MPSVPCRIFDLQSVCANTQQSTTPKTASVHKAMQRACVSLSHLDAQTSKADFRRSHLSRVEQVSVREYVSGRLLICDAESHCLCCLCSGGARPSHTGHPSLRGGPPKSVKHPRRCLVVSAQLLLARLPGCLDLLEGLAQRLCHLFQLDPSCPRAFCLFWHLQRRREGCSLQTGFKHENLR